MDNLVDKKWYVARTHSKHEKKVFEKVTNLGIKAYLPRREEIRQWHDRKKKIEVVLTPGVVFVFTDKDTVLSLPNEYGIKVSYMLDRMNPKNGLLVVPDYQMDDFMNFVGMADDSFRIEEELLYAKGDKIIVTVGPMKGLTGELIKVGMENRMIVRLDGVLACSVRMTTDMFERI